MTSDEICRLTLKQASDALRQARLTPLDLTRACLQRIQQRDKQINSFIAIYEKQALADAAALTADLKAGYARGPLHGIPVALKDLIDLAGHTTTAASEQFLENRATQDADVTRRLKEAGAVILGKTNLHEFAYGGSGMISHFGVVRNPVNPEYITGGSSSGSAAAVAAGFCFAAIGTDTAGSIRLPASCCGIVGLKPTFGHVSTDGVVPLAWSYDHVGPMARTVEDAGIVLSAISNAVLHPIDASHLKFGLAKRFFFDNCDDEIAASVTRIADKLSAVEVEVPVDEDRTMSNSEAFAFHQHMVATFPERYNPETLRRIRSGENIPAATFINRKRELDRLRHRTFELFRNIDVIITPTVPIPPSKIAELEQNPDRLRPRELMMLRNTRPFNVLGIPAISVPCGVTKSGLPIGIQLAAAMGREDVLIAAGKLIEKLQRD